MVSPPQSPTQKQIKILPPLEAYLKHLLMVSLEPDANSVSFASKQILRFPWSDPAVECGALVVKYMLKACRRGRYKAVASVAAIAANLRRSKPEVLTRLIDSVLEELQWFMDRPSFRDQQRTVMFSRLLGELHRTSLVPSSVIFEQLYRFLNFGHEIPNALREASKRYKADASGDDSPTSANAGTTVSPFLASGGDIRQTIDEDEELDDDEVAAQEIPEEPTIVAVSSHSKYDPRVPCPVDPLTSAFRIKLVCTVLETVGPIVATGGGNRSKLEGFLAAFQRYLFTKSFLPAEVEFSVLDLFDSLDSYSRQRPEKEQQYPKRGKGAKNRMDQKSLVPGFIRYKTWIEAHNATVAVEEAEAMLDARAEARLLTQAGVAPVGADADDIGDEDGADLDGDEYMSEEEDESIDDPFSVNGISAKDEDSLGDGLLSEEDSGDEDDDSVGSESDEGSAAEDICDDDGSDGGSDEESEDETDYENDTDEDDDEEDIDEVTAHEVYMRQLEEEAFERELRKITMEALERGKVAAKTGTGGKVSDTMPAASQISKKTLEGGDINSGGVSTGITHMMALGGKDGIGFQLLKKGHRGRVEAKQIAVPADTNLARLATRQDDEAARERDMLKARVLRYEAESAEQQYSGNVYMEQTKLQVIRNRPLTMDEIDRNFGSSGGDFDRRSNSNREGGGTERPRSRHGHGGGRGGGRLWDGGRMRGGRG